MKTNLQNHFKQGHEPLKLAHSNMPAIPEGREGYVPIKHKMPQFIDATRNKEGERIYHKMSLAALIFVR